MKPILSILTPNIPSRLMEVAHLGSLIRADAGSLPVEHIYLGDNLAMTIGEKRDLLVTAARGEYIAFCDDDDEILPGYCANLISAIQNHAPTVVTFLQEAVINGESGKIHFAASHQFDEPWRAGHTARRRPWHVCAWKKSVVGDCQFLHVNYGEDAAWVAQTFPLISRGAHVNKVLHRYIHSAETTAAPAPNAGEKA
jgi:hypothetical protein